MQVAHESMVVMAYIIVPRYADILQQDQPSALKPTVVLYSCAQ
jgi:hypothetical protein